MRFFGVLATGEGNDEPAPRLVDYPAALCDATRAHVPRGP